LRDHLIRVIRVITWEPRREGREDNENMKGREDKENMKERKKRKKQEDDRDRIIDLC
jgi:hypothetical protein